MEPFDLERAKAGDKVYDANSQNVVHFVGINSSGEYIIQRDVTWQYCERAASELRMAPKKRTVWVNLYEGTVWVNLQEAPTPRHDTYVSVVYGTEEEANEDQWDSPKRIGGRAYPIEIED